MESIKILFCIAVQAVILWLFCNIPYYLSLLGFTALSVIACCYIPYMPVFIGYFIFMILQVCISGKEIKKIIDNQ